jgi:anti-sigma factor RsiW
MSEPAAELSCKELVEVITEYFDGAMTTDDRARFERHLEGCAGCQAVVAQFRTTIEVTGRLTEDLVTEGQRAAMRDVFLRWRGSARAGPE